MTTKLSVTKREEREGLRTVNINLPTALWHQVDAIAEAEDRNVANMTRVLLREALAARAAKQAPRDLTAGMPAAARGVLGR